MSSKKELIAKILQSAVSNQFKKSGVNLTLDHDEIADKIGEGLVYLGMLPALVEQNPDIFKDQMNLVYSKDLEDISSQVHLVLTEFITKKIYDESHLPQQIHLSIN